MTISNIEKYERKNSESIHVIYIYLLHLYAVPDLGSTAGWSLGPQNLGGLRPRCMVF